MKAIIFSILLSFFALSAGALANPSFQSPEESLQSYLSACEQGDFEAAVACYTKSSRELAKSQAEQFGPGDPEMLRQTHQRLKDMEFKLEQVNGKRAILWPSDDSIPPFLLRIQEQSEEWRLDYHFMSHYIKVSENGWSWRDPRLFGIWKKRE